ncbi:DNA-directed RNA polymerase subunit RPC12/RpoP [Methanococcus maripaludis]|uniref:DNA-directed RNA polymerase subunit RPC12/RpoP n=1 Tax=Methanococcus maripaludis TaxID=39152 RepID=A0A7J9NWS0_METMI|nr:hypothetical protein [Methanococcus maripaludis]MBA2851751.1 DNA-directed RNA polymerase subunit RPC12/RpoP [Methanococcus maripaludis]
MYSFTCSHCDKDFFGDESVKYCPYCGHDDFLKFNPNQYASTSKIHKFNPMSYVYPPVDSMDDKALLNLAALLLKNQWRSGKSAKITFSEEPNLHPETDLRTFHILSTEYAKRVGITRNISDSHKPTFKSEETVYTELRYVGKDRQVCFGQANDVPSNVDLLTQFYLENGWAYYFVKGDKIEQVIRGLNDGKYNNR